MSESDPALDELREAYESGQLIVFAGPGVCTRYHALLCRVFSDAAKIMKRNSIVYVRTDRRKVTYDATIEALRFAFPKRRIMRLAQPFEGPTQTRLFGDHSQKVGEVDLILHPV